MYYNAHTCKITLVLPVFHMPSLPLRRHFIFRPLALDKLGCKQNQENNMSSPKVTLHHLENSRSLRIIFLLEELKLNYNIIEYKRNPGKLSPSSQNLFGV